MRDRLPLKEWVGGELKKLLSWNTRHFFGCCNTQILRIKHTKRKRERGIEFLSRGVGRRVCHVLMLSVDGWGVEPRPAPPPPKGVRMCRRERERDAQRMRERENRNRRS